MPDFGTSFSGGVRNESDPLKQLTDDQSKQDPLTAAWNWLQQQPGWKDDGWSWHPFDQWLTSEAMHDFVFGSPEQQLARAIAEKVAPGEYQTNPHVTQLANEAAHKAQTDPAYRDRVAQQLGWNQKNPHVAYWLQHGGAMPADPTGTGIDPTPGGKTAATTAAAKPAASIGAPFDPSKWGGRANDPGYTYGAVLDPAIAAAAGVSQQWGVDYALPMGTPQNSPFAGTVQEANFNGPYGYTVVVRMANGYTYRVAHLEYLSVKKGDTIAVGTELGPTGSTGNSTGPHVLIEMRDSSGKPIDPTPIIDGLLKGDPTGASKVFSDYQTAQTAAGGPILTSDGHLIYPGSQDYNVFFAAQSLWRKRYGIDPPWSFVSSLMAQGATTTEQVQNQMDQMGSDIPNMNWGQRDMLTGDVTTAAQKAWNRPVPDATVKQLAALGITTPAQVQGWITSHPASALDPGTYAQYFDAANPEHQKLWQQPPSPDMIAHIHEQMQKGPQG